MATLKYVLQSKSGTANIYIRFSISRSNIIYRKTGLIIEVNDWIDTKGEPKNNKNSLKNIKSKLDKLAVFITDSYNDATSKNEPITGEWLQLQIDLFNNKTPVVELDVLTTYIQKYIDEAPYKQNAKKELGLSVGRVKNLKLFKSTILRYEKENFKGKSILIKDINLKFIEQFKGWLFAQKYSINYVGKNLNNIKTICFDAKRNDIETSTQFESIKSVAETKAPENIVILSELEQEQIKDAVLLREALINARKWLLLGCLVGQRAGDLLGITEKNIKELNGIKIIELKQQKTGKLVAVPLLPEALEILESGFPYKTSLVRFNEYIKDVCQIAGINEILTGRIKTKQNCATTFETEPKYKFITSHVMRRSFASNFYGRIPTPVLMNITAHGTERIFLQYIGKTTYDNAYQMLDYFSKLPKKDKNAQMKVIKNGTENE